MDKLTYQAIKSRHPKKDIIKWVVKQGTTVIYENTQVSLCYHFIHVHGLKTTPQAIR